VATAHEGGLSRLEVAQDLALLTQEETPEVLTAAFLRFAEGHSVKQVGQVLNQPRKKVEEMLKGFLKRARARRQRFETWGAP
jgi:RNA polymerase sigma-70 factor (ECF subfamily)